MKMRHVAKVAAVTTAAITIVCGLRVTKLRGVTAALLAAAGSR